MPQPYRVNPNTVPVLPTMPREIELKFAVIKGSPAALRRVLPHCRFDRTLIHDQYFDTRDQLLRRRGTTLRLRRDGDKWLQTLKADAREHALAADRSEWEIELSEAKVDASRFDAAARALLADAGVDSATLQPVFRSTVERRRAVVLQEESRIEIACDRGEIVAPFEAVTVRMPLEEVELELKSGRVEDLLDLALALVDASHGLRLVPAARSKAERGFALASGAAPDTKRASARTFTAGLQASMSTGAALRTVISSGLRIVVANAEAMRASVSPELVHQTRVALRRMRSAIRLLDPAGDDLPLEMSRRLRWLARKLGQARDLDILVESTLPTITEAQSTDRDALQRVVRRARRKRKKARVDAVQAVSSRRFAKLTLRLARWATSAPPESKRLNRIAAQLLDATAGDVFANARSFIALAPRERHQVRIRAKRLRYALDLLAVALPAQATQQYVDALALLQDALGELNDAAVGVDLLTGDPNRRRTNKRIRAWHKGLEPKLAHDAARRLAALARRPAPWRAQLLDAATSA